MRGWAYAGRRRHWHACVAQACWAHVLMQVQSAHWPAPAMTLEHWHACVAQACWAHVLMQVQSAHDLGTDTCASLVTTTLLAGVACLSHANVSHRAFIKVQALTWPRGANAPIAWAGAGLVPAPACTYAHRDPAMPAAQKIVKSAWGCAKEAGVWLNIRFSTFDVVKCMCILAVATATDGRGSHQAARGAGLAVTSQALVVRCVCVASS